MNPWVILPLPCALAIIFWQRTLVAKLAPGFFQTPNGVETYSVEHFINNSAIFFKSLVDFKFIYPFASIVNLVGMVFIAYCVFFRWKDLAKIGSARRILLLITVVSVLALWAVYNGFHMGGMHVRASNRYYILFAVILSTLAVLALVRTRFFYRRPFLILLFALLMHGLYYPEAFHSPSLRILPRTKFHLVTHEFLKTVPDSRFLVVTIRPQHFVIDNYAAINFHTANRYAKGLLNQLRTGFYSNIYVISEIEISNTKTPRNMVLNSRYSLETIFEQPTKKNKILRISRVIHPPDPAKGGNP